MIKNYGKAFIASPLCVCVFVFVSGEKEQNEICFQVDPLSLLSHRNTRRMSLVGALDKPLSADKLIKQGTINKEETFFTLLCVADRYLSAALKETAGNVETARIN